MKPGASPQQRKNEMSTKTKTQHTPGPWKLLSPDQVRGSEGQWICSCEGGRHREEKDAANARLIAAAPELLSALEEAGEALTSAMSVINAEDDTGKAYPKTREAIRNAQGKRFAAIARATS